MLLIEEKLLLNNKKDLILTHLYIKSKERAQDLYKKNKDFRFTEAVRELVYHLYEMGGIESKEDFREFVEVCSKNTPISNEDSVRNTLSKCVGVNIVKNIGKYKKVVSEDWLPRINDDLIGLDYKITTKEAVGAV